MLFRSSPQGLTANLRKKLASTTPQLEIFEVIYDKASENDGIMNKIKEIDLDDTSPTQAWTYLSELQKELLGES